MLNDRPPEPEQRVSSAIVFAFAFASSTTGAPATLNSCEGRQEVMLQEERLSAAPPGLGPSLVGAVRRQRPV